MNLLAEAGMPHLGKLVSSFKSPFSCTVVLCTCSSMGEEQAFT